MMIKGYELEFYEDTHQYVCDGVMLKSITQLLKQRFPDKYANVSEEVLQQAAVKGTQMHEAIERWCKYGEESELQELRNFKFLQRMYQFEVLGNEVPVILFYEDEPIAAGRLDMVLKMDGKVGLADLKRTSVLDKNYLAYQLNLYRIAYQQCYDTEIEFLRGIHLRDDKRKFVTIPITDDYINGYIKELKDGGII